MVFFQFTTVFESRVSRLIAGYPLFFTTVMTLLFVSCTNHKEREQPEIKIAKTIPRVYLPVLDSSLKKHNDTLYRYAQYYTGHTFFLYENGDTAFVNGYFNGVEEGVQKQWYADGQLQEERFYINGKKEGTHQGWWPDGKLKFFFTANSDEYEGEFKEWYSSGLLGKYFHYKKGQEEGSQRLWWDNGKVRANYVIKNGKKYGLIGLTLCMNPYDSITAK